MTLTSILCEGLHGRLEVEMGAREEGILVGQGDKGYPLPSNVDREDAGTKLKEGGRQAR